MEVIAKHTFYFCCHPAMVSTVELFGKFETMVMYDDGEEIESAVSATLEEARKTHNALVRKYNNLIYADSFQRLIGEMNYGQFVTLVKTC